LLLLLLPPATTLLREMRDGGCRFFSNEPRTHTLKKSQRKRSQSVRFEIFNEAISRSTGVAAKTTPNPPVCRCRETAHFFFFKLKPFSFPSSYILRNRIEVGISAVKKRVSVTALLLAAASCCRTPFHHKKACIDRVICTGAMLLLYTHPTHRLRRRLRTREKKNPFFPFFSLHLLQ
jgi:hypothetical protein